MKYLFKHQDKILPKIKKSKNILLFLDYDGTLTPIVSRPQDAKFSFSVKKLLKKLKKHPKFSLAIISGRSLKDVKAMVGIDGLIYAGNHGLEVEAPFKVSVPDVTKAGSILRQISLVLIRKLKDIEGVKVENKTYTLSLHFRLVKPSKRKIVEGIFEETVKDFVDSKKIKVSSGKMVFEVRPPIKWGKGNIVLEILKKKKKSLVFYLGDDVTDEDAFKAIKLKGISIFVGPGKTKSRADYFLKNTKGVESFLKLLTSLEK
ncbi:MAG: trehalose-phosphatase [Candidatus Omnitrophota bacterium]